MILDASIQDTENDNEYTYVPTVSYSDWDFSVYNFQVGSTVKSFKDPLVALIDVSSSLITSITNWFDWKFYTRALNRGLTVGLTVSLLDRGLLVCEFSETLVLPDIRFEISGTTLTIHGIDYQFFRAIKDGKHLLFTKVALNLYDEITLMEPLLNSYSVSMDGDNYRVGFYLVLWCFGIGFIQYSRKEKATIYNFKNLMVQELIQ